MKSFKHFAFIFIIVPSFLLSSCDRCEKGSGNVISVTRSVPSFHQVTLRGSYNLYIRQDSVQRVEVIADDNIAPLLETVVENNNLIIRQRKSECTKKSTRTDVYVSVPSLTSITLDGSGNIQGQNTFTTPQIETLIKGSGILTLSYEGNSVRGVIDGSGNLNLSGSSNTASYTITGSGHIGAQGVNAKDVQATISGSGNIVLTATATLNANITGSGNISYFGNPVTTVNVSGSGNVTKK